MRKLLKTAQARLLGRAVFTGVAAFAALEKVADDPFSKTALTSAAVAGALAAAEYITPLNALIGFFKNPPATR